MSNKITILTPHLKDGKKAYFRQEVNAKKIGELLGELAKQGIVPSHASIELEWDYSYTNSDSEEKYDAGKQQEILLLTKGLI